MRYFILDVKPTDEEVKNVDGGIFDGDVLGASYRGKYLVSYDDEKHVKPRWLNGAEELNIPGEPHACWNCGALYDDRPTPGPGGVGG